MTSRKFYRTLFTVEVLSEEPVPDDMDLEGILEECTSGSYSGDVKRGKCFILNGQMAAQGLLRQRSDPGFFQLTEKGEDIDE